MKPPIVQPSLPSFSQTRMARPVSNHPTYVRYASSGKPIAFGNDPTASPAEPAEPTNTSDTATYTGNWFSRLFWGMVSGIGHVFYYLWPLNWPIFQRKPANPSAANASGKVDTVTSPTVKPEPLKPPEGPAPAINPAKPAADESFIQEKPIEKPPTGFSKLLKWGFRMALNTFHIGAALVILAGAPFFPGPLLYIGATMGLMIMQSWVAKRFGDHADVTDPKKMAVIARRIKQRYIRAVSIPKNLLKKTWLTRWMVPMYNGLAIRFGSLMERATRFMTSTVLVNAIQATALPKDFWHWPWYRKGAHLVMQGFWMSLGMVTKFLGPFGKWLHRVLDLQSKVSIATIAIPKTGPTAGSTEKAPPAGPPKTT